VPSKHVMEVRFLLGTRLVRILAGAFALAGAGARAAQVPFPGPLPAELRRALDESRGVGKAPALPDYAPFQTSELPHALTRAQVQALVQRFVDAKHGKAFRHLGDDQDFDHGHLLFKDKQGGRPVAVLFHTQERASRWSSEDPGGKYDYVDKKGRNWIVWLDPDKPIENARDYERAAYPDTPEWREWVKLHLEMYQGAFTITYDMLDPKKLGVDPDLGFPSKRLNDQFNFHRTDCARLPRPLPEDKAFIEVLLPAASPGAARERVCLALTRGS
jgi:hypothetical protein